MQRCCGKRLFKRSMVQDFVVFVSVSAFRIAPGPLTPWILIGQSLTKMG
ncbi:hypothetical protein D3OALGA1CA_2178 [Olavius algarvensis associated proteobacterium Delta 3]|nr:hypothetical protein D3OALGA1CA_2178 [Olavius algarvensis associated proteobacterium Delta 3]